MFGVVSERGVLNPIIEILRTNQTFIRHRIKKASTYLQRSQCMQLKNITN